VHLPLSQESAAVPISVTTFGPQNPPAISPAGAQIFVATIEVVSDLGQSRLREWQLETYRALSAAYRQRRDEYQKLTGTGGNAGVTRNPLASRDAIRQSLRQDIIDQLIRQASALTGETVELMLGRPRYLQFLDQALEWNEMAYSFLGSPESTAAGASGGGGSGDEPFTAFLQAGFARVLLPVHPDYSFVFPYYLASGMIWDGHNLLAPANPESVDLINEIKSAPEPCREQEHRSMSWEIRLPSTMVVLQEHGNLPRFRDDHEVHDDAPVRIR